MKEALKSACKIQIFLFSKYSTVDGLLDEIESFRNRLIKDGLSALNDIKFFSHQQYHCKKYRL